MSNQSLGEKYRKLDEIEHCLLRPGMWVGSIKPKTDVVRTFVGGHVERRSLSYNPAFIKIFDEIVSNSVDEHRRNKRLRKIDVTIDQGTHRVSVTDDGGIPVERHPESGEWIPEMIFSNLRAGSNFNDDDQRTVAGTNGVGSTLTNIFSTAFLVKTCDGKNEFEQTFTDNMRNRSEPVVKKKRGGFTSIEYTPDLKRFEMTSVDDDHVAMMKKRVIDAAATNPGLVTTFNGESFKFSSFEEYCKMYSNDAIYESNERWQIAIAASEGSLEHVSFVNSVETSDGGTHVEHVVNQVVDWVRDHVRRRHKIDMKPSEVKNHIFVMVNATIVNPMFSSQTKEKLITEQRDFGSSIELSQKVLRRLADSELVKRLLDWAQQKELAEERRQQRELNKLASKGKVLKLVEAKGRDRSECTLSLYEGNSAMTAFRKFRNPQTQGAFPLRGKFINVSEHPVIRVMQNQEVRDLVSAIGLKMGEPPNDIRYGKILIYSDADPDGDCIAALLVNFFGRYWPELFAQGKVYRVMTPLVVAERGRTKHVFYTREEFDRWIAGLNGANGWQIEYKKGLAGLSDPEFEKIIREPNAVQIRDDSTLRSSLDSWFSAGGIDYRKEKILEAKGQVLNEKL